MNIDKSDIVTLYDLEVLSLGRLKVHFFRFDERIAGDPWLIRPFPEVKSNKMLRKLAKTQTNFLQRR